MTQLIGAKVLDLRKRSVLMTVTVLFTVGLPVFFYGIRAIYHLSDPARYGPPARRARSRRSAPC